MTADMVEIQTRRRAILVAEVVAIIGRDRARVDKIEAAIQKLDVPVYKPLTKQDKAVARSLARSLARLDYMLRRPDVRELLLTRMMVRFEGWVAGLKQFLMITGKVARWPLGRPKPSAERFARKNIAVAEAAKLMDLHGLPRTVTRKSNNRKASTFCRLAAALSGDRHADLYHQCRAYNKARNRGSK